MPVDVGHEPDPVVAPNQTGEQTRIDFSDPTVVYFYPEDGTLGCTTEAEQFEFERETYDEAGVRVVGVSRDTVEDHRQFHDEQDLSFDLLADPGGDVGDAFDVERMPDGRYERTTFVVVDGEVWKVYTGVTADGHARTVLIDMFDAGLVDLDF